MLNLLMVGKIIKIHLIENNRVIKLQDIVSDIIQMKLEETLLCYTVPQVFYQLTCKTPPPFFREYKINTMNTFVEQW